LSDASGPFWAHGAGIETTFLPNHAGEKFNRERVLRRLLLQARTNLIRRIRRAASGELYYMIPTGRTEAEWKKWDPHGSLHKDGRSHHKSFDQKLLPKKGQKPDANFKGTEPWITRPIASGEPRTFGEVCNRRSSQK
jgi:hypothetical protein